MGPHFDQEHHDHPFKGPFGTPDGKKKPSGCPFSRRQNSDERGPPPFMFGPGFGPKEWHQGPGHHGPKDCHRGPPKDCHRGPPKECHRGWFYNGPKQEDGPSPHHFFGHHGFKHGRDERHYDWRGPSNEHYGPPRHWFGGKGPSESEERPKGPWGKSWGPWAGAWGSDQK